MDDTEHLLHPSLSVRVAAALTAATGLLALTFSLQQSETIWFEFRFLNATPWLALVSGLALVALALKIYRGRLWAGRAGLALAAFVAIWVSAWGVIALIGAMFSLLAVMLAGFAVGALVTLSSSLSHLQQMQVAREKLAAEGLDLGF